MIDAGVPNLTTSHLSGEETITSKAVLHRADRDKDIGSSPYVKLFVHLRATKARGHGAMCSRNKQLRRQKKSSSFFEKTARRGRKSGCPHRFGQVQVGSMWPVSPGPDRAGIWRRRRSSPNTIGAMGAKSTDAPPQHCSHTRGICSQRRRSTPIPATLKTETGSGDQRNGWTTVRPCGVGLPR